MTDFITPLLEQLNTMYVSFIKMLPILLIATVVLVITNFIVKLALVAMENILQKSGLRQSLQSLILTLVKVGIWVFGTLVALTIVFPSLTPAKMLTALGLGSIAVGFAFKDIFENFIGGIMIMLRKPMRIGDFIECESFAGRIEQIHIRESYLRQTDGQLIIVPNIILFTNPVYVRTDLKVRRFEIVCGVSYNADLHQAKQLIQQAVEGVDGLDKNKPIEIFAREFNASSMDFTIRWWAKSEPRDEHDSRDRVIFAVKKALDDAGIEIPFPQRTLTFAEGLTVNKTKENN